MAGLYHYSLPILGSLIEIFREKCPQRLKKPIRSLLDTSIDWFQYAAQPLLSSIFRFADKLTNHNLSGLIDRLKRLPVPLKTITQLVTQEKLLNLSKENRIQLMNSAYLPLPWKPFSITDLFGFLNQTVESPSLGVIMSVFSIALFDDLCKLFISFFL